MNKLYEQEMLTVADNYKDRLLQYLKNEDLVEKIAAVARHTDEDGDFQVKLNKEDYDFLENDDLWMKVVRNKNEAPKIKIWVQNDNFIFDDIDFKALATILYSSARGYGTDEDKFASVAGVIGRLAREKRVDPDILFKRLDDSILKRYSNDKGEPLSLAHLIESEFSGRAEAAGLNTFRRDIPKSVYRGVVDNIGTIVGDVALTALTFGGGTIITKFLQVGSKSGKIGKAITVATKAAPKAVGGVKTVTGGGKVLTGLDRVWKGLSTARKFKTFKNAFPVGHTLEYVKKGSKVGHSLQKIEKYDNATKMVTFAGKGGVAEFSVHINNILDFTKVGKAGGLTTNTIGKLKIPGAFAAKKLADMGNNFEIDTSSGFNVAELMGYYDTLASNPDEYTDKFDFTNSDFIASTILELKEGSGIFGNTTEQEELAIGLLITSLQPQECVRIDKRYRKLDPGSNIYAVLDDELSGDLGIFTKAWWAGCTGITDSEYSKQIENIYNSVKK